MMLYQEFSLSRADTALSVSLQLYKTKFDYNTL